MEEKKKQRKSTRSFNMEKHVERHFDIEKEQASVTSSSPVVENTSGTKATVGGEKQNGNKKLLVAILVIVVLAILVFFVYKGCSSGSSEMDKTPVVEQSDSTSKEKTDSVTEKNESTQASDASDPNTDVSNSNVSKDAQTTSKASSQSANSSSEKTVDEKAKEVWDGVYGNGTERKNRLGSEYNAVQKRVNEMYRNGYRH